MKTKRNKTGGGRAYHSILEGHLDFIQGLRRQRRTWKEIAQILAAEKGIRVTLYAAYYFCRRRRHGRLLISDIADPAPAAVPQAVKDLSTPPRKSPLVPKPTFRRPNRESLESDSYL